MCTDNLYIQLVQTTCTDNLYRQLVQTTCTDNLYRQLVQTTCTDNLYRQLVQTTCTDNLCRQLVQDLCVGLQISLILLMKSFYFCRGLIFLFLGTINVFTCSSIIIYARYSLITTLLHFNVVLTSIINPIYLFSTYIYLSKYKIQSIIQIHSINPMSMMYIMY